MSLKFTDGNKVFAKVRGYPPWPARVEGTTDDNSKIIKYHVYFYGTGETAILKAENLCSYVENKLKLVKDKKYYKKNLKFADAIGQIEFELSPEELATLSKLEANQQLNSISSDNCFNGSKQNAGKNNISKSPIKRNQKFADSIGQIEVEDKRIKLDDFHPEPPEKEETVVNVQNPVPGPSGVCKPKNIPSIPVIEAEGSESPTEGEASDGNATDVNRICNVYKVHPCINSVLKTELEMLQTALSIATVVTPEHTDTEKCISLLDKLNKLKITPLMLKKRPDVEYIIRRVMGYIGFFPESMNVDDKLQVQKNARIIRENAKLIYSKFRSLFSVPRDRYFRDFFQEEREKFEKKIEFINPYDFVILVKEP